MTNYADMPAGPEMDRLVAEKVMGWISAGSPYWYKDGYNVQSVYEWQPSARIDNAWQVVEKMEERGSPLRMMFKSIHDKGYWARFGDGPQNFYGDTAPLAICRAALIAMESK